MDADGNGTPASQARIEAQIAAESPYVTALTSYATVSYQAPTRRAIRPATTLQGSPKPPAGIDNPPAET